MGGDGRTGREAVGDPISIPAPAWGATVCGEEADSYYKISIPAPAWGATGMDVVEFFSEFNFNSRPRVGGDHCVYVVL